MMRDSNNIAELISLALALHRQRDHDPWGSQEASFCETGPSKHLVNATKKIKGCQGIFHTPPTQQMTKRVALSTSEPSLRHLIGYDKKGQRHFGFVMKYNSLSIFISSPRILHPSYIQ